MNAAPGFETRLEQGVLLVELRGDWSRSGPGKPAPSELLKKLDSSAPAKVSFRLSDSAKQDVALPGWLLEAAECLKREKREVDFDSLPESVRRPLAMALSVPEREDADRRTEPPGFVERIGKGAQTVCADFRELLGFIGECVIAFGKLLRGRARFRRVDLMLFIQEAGAEALMINLMISFLVGLILAFVGAVQLQQFGASIYVANLVGIAMVREMGCIMSGIIMSGRTGASYAAQLGTMKVNQETDAFRTFQFSPIEFLVLPRMLALLFMMPLLTVFSNLAGIVGGLLIGVFMLDLSFLEYWNQTVNSLTLTNCAVGVTKSFFFGIIVAVTGCFNGMRCENNAAGVGKATTKAVVSGIMSIVAADAVFAVLFNILKI